MAGMERKYKLWNGLFENFDRRRDVSGRPMLVFVAGW
ncbi:hypothetical protein Rleg4DRAFT_2222 [Rhizobium leguminosarum bv. trifolii WSM2297]|uniref:Uncharacterized protein n=1 Tax=Rhizobium leguminosarum bv. trifolii WSM2297 TaxID=754762 RepID=J0KSN6_RHILT|nr:hypothetical protein Rleg4DRAFT_2222 [Rhizobium leguminosarum bv. trifolii WSM2297]